MTEEELRIVQAWKDANGYNDLVDAYCHATNDLTAARARIAELEGILAATTEQLKCERETARRAGITTEAVREVLLSYEGGETTLSRAVEQLRALCLANTRIAELEDWQRRALEWMRAEVAGDMSVRCGCARCAERMRLVEEATR